MKSCLESVALKLEIKGRQIQPLFRLKFYSNADFDKKKLNDNIAILALSKPIKLVEEDSVNAACLPACNNMFDHTFANKTGSLTTTYYFPNTMLLN